MTKDIEDMIDSDSTADSSIEAEDKEESLISSANTLAKEEAVMVQNVDTPPKGENKLNLNEIQSLEKC